MTKQKSSRGFTLIETLVAVAIVGVVFLTLNQFFGRELILAQREKLKFTQLAIASTLRNGLSSPGQIFYSASRYDVNPTLARCLLGLANQGESSCRNAIDAKTPVRFALFQTASQAGTEAIQLSTGEMDSGIYYDAQGKQCSTPGKGSCVLQAHSYFYVSCERTFDPDCLRGPAQLYLTFSVEQISTLLTRLGAGIPPQPAVKTVIPLSVLQIIGPDRYGKCDQERDKFKEASRQSDEFSRQFPRGKFASVVGYDQSGNPTCRCLHPFVPVEERNTNQDDQNFRVPVCRLLTRDELFCPGGTVLRSFDSDGRVKPTCLKSDSASYCRQIDASQSCAAGEWMAKAARNNCLFTCDYLAVKNQTCILRQKHLGKRDSGAAPVQNPQTIIPGMDCFDNTIICCRPRGGYRD